MPQAIELYPSPTKFPLSERVVSFVGRYGLAASAVATTTLLRVAADDWLTDPGLLFLAAISLVAWSVGRGPSYLAVGLSAFMQARYLIAPDQVLLATVPQGIALAVWVMEAALVCVLFGALQDAKTRALDAAETLARNQALLEDREERLRGARDYLEREVTMRTAQLARSNEDLRRGAAERERMTEQLRQGQKMEAVGRLAGGVAHDFNNVLAVILSVAALNVEDLEEGTPLWTDLEEIAKAARRGADLTRQLLTFSRQQVVEAKLLNVQDVIADMDAMLRRLAGESVVLTTPTTRPAGSVRIDSGSMGQLVMNLVVNARDAMPKGGRVDIALADVVLDASFAESHIDAQPGPYVMLTVSDTGSGMDKATQERIFEPFFTTKEKGKGTGLGLATVFGIVQQAGGRIAVSSEEGVGTTFRIYLPCVDAAPDDSDRPTAPAVNLRGDETILLVEDEESVRAVAGEILRRSGYRVLEASDGHEALRVCERETAVIHLVLSDVVMPNMGGPELAARLALVRPAAHVICMSGYTDEAVVGPNGLGPGVAFIRKPFEPVELTRKVREVLNAGSAERGSA